MTIFAITSVNVDTTLDDTNFTVLVDASGGNRIINLPTAIGIAGTVYNIKKTDSSINTVTIDGNGAQTIDGKITKIITTQYENVTIQSDGANWVIL